MVPPGGVDDEIASGRDGHIRQSEKLQLLGIVAQMPAVQVHRFGGGIIQLDPVLELAGQGPPVLGIAGHGLVDEDGAGTRGVLGLPEGV